MLGKNFNGWIIKPYNNGEKDPSVIAQGGIAILRYAENSLGKKAVVKFLKPKFHDNEQHKKRIVREAKTLLKLNHPNIVQVIDLVDTDEYLGLIMEFLDGEDLKEKIKKEDCTINEETLVLWLIQITDALDHAHTEFKIYHRDIKPSNLFLTKRGQIKLIDFGIVKEAEAEEEITQTMQMVGTPAYMSPEQVETPTEVDGRSDIYSLAATAVTLLTGELPYGKTTSSSLSVYALQRQVVDTPVVIPDHISEGLKKVLAKALEKKKEDRYSTCREFKTALEEACLQPSPPPSPKTKKTKPKAVLGLSFLLVMLIALIAWWMFPNSGNCDQCYTYEQPATIGGKKKALVEIMPNSLTSTIIEIDREKHWEVFKQGRKANTVVMEGIQSSQGRDALREYIGSILEQGVNKEDIEFLTTSEYKPDANVSRVVELLKGIDNAKYNPTIASPKDRAEYTMHALLNEENEQQSLVALFENDRLIVGWREQNHTPVSHIANSVNGVNEIAEIIPNDRSKCFVVGGLPDAMAANCNSRANFICLPNPPEEDKYSTGRFAAQKAFYDALLQNTSFNDIIVGQQANYALGYLINQRY